MKQKRVSTVIPVFNGSNYMREAIDSALAQTWKNHEVIVVNDGSSDNGATDKIARSYGNRIKYITKSNGGVSTALNAGITVMTGDVFCWLSHDDRHLPRKIEWQMREWEKHSHDNVVFFTDYRLVDAGGAVISDVNLDHHTLSSKPLYPLLRGSIHGCSIFVPRVIIDDVGTFNAALPTTQDYDLWHRMIRKYRFIHIPKIMIESRWHDEQASKKLDHVVEATGFWKRVVEDVPIADRVRSEGSSFRFLNEMAKFLDANKLTEAGAHLRSTARAELESTTVSIVIPVYDRADLAVSSIESAARQTHRPLEIIVVNDGSTEPMDPVHECLKRHSGLATLIDQPNQGPAAARNTGWAAAKGDYVAFLDSDDLFLPQKIAVQLEAMMDAGATFSHTSYFRHWFHRSGLTYMPSGAGNTFPSIIGGCGIATPTVMLRTKLFQEGFRFPTEYRLGEDISLWLRIAKKHSVLGIDRGLTVVRADSNSSAYDPAKQVIGVQNVLQLVKSDPELSVFSDEVSRLEAHLVDLGAA